MVKRENFTRSYWVKFDIAIAILQKMYNLIESKLFNIMGAPILFSPTVMVTHLLSLRAKNLFLHMLKMCAPCLKSAYGKCAYRDFMTTCRYLLCRLMAKKKIFI